MSTIPHEKTGYTGVLSQFSPNRFFELSGENTKAFRICLIKTRKNQKKPVISKLPGNGGVQIAAENRIDITTQNPPLATAYRFESGHRHQEQRTCAAGPLLFSLNGQKKIRILKLWSFGRGEHRSEAFLCDPTVALEKIR